MATNTTHATSQASVSESNRSRIVKHLYHNGISSRAQIAKALELTPAAITKITARLIEAGMIEETGDLEGSKNRRSIGLKLNTTRFRVIGIKFARSLVQIGVFGLCGNALSIENLPTVYDNTIDDTIATIHQRVEQL
ncbi:winged helix-turn-helix transcriptional regulator, partial [Bifidobacterium pseudocatenulatum]